MIDLFSGRVVAALSFAAGMFLPYSIVASAQASQDQPLAVTAREISQAEAVTDWWAHFKPTDDVANKITHAALTVGKPAPAPARPFLQLPQRSGVQAVAPTFYYPGDMSYQGGAVVKSATQQLIFLNPPSSFPGNPGCAPSTPGGCWGNPRAFMVDLNVSSFISIVDQYVQTSGSGRFPALTNKIVMGSYPHIMHDSDIQAIVLAAVNAGGGAGYNRMYHVFLPPGQDECFDGTNSQCYAPDGAANFVFCAYHSSFSTPAGRVVYSVEPYQDVNGCRVNPPAPGHSVLQDSTDSVLSHETFEAITNPDGDAWWVTTGGIYGSEIGDTCHLPPAPTHLVGANNYATQLEYSNASHGCAITP
jgi:hypothetical protein